MELLAPRAELILKCFQLTLGTSRKASNFSHAEIWKICRLLLSRGGISLKQANHNSVTSAPSFNLSIDKEAKVIFFMDLQREMISLESFQSISFALSHLRYQLLANVKIIIRPSRGRTGTTR